MTNEKFIAIMGILSLIGVLTAIKFVLTDSEDFDKLWIRRWFRNEVSINRKGLWNRLKPTRDEALLPDEKV
jgi:hypothetical protein